MPSDKVHARKEPRRFTIVVVPGSESKGPRTFSVSLGGILASLSGAFFGIAILTIAVLNFTPARFLLPVSNSELEKRYGTRILEIQDEVYRLAAEMNKLRGYNLRLRKALGESIPSTDSMLVGTSALSISTQTPRPQRVESLLTQPPNDLVTIGDLEKIRGGLPADLDRRSLRPPLELPFTMPVSGYVTRGFDVRYHHYGIDFAGREGSSVLAAADGCVIFSGWTYDDGLMAMIVHDRGYVTVYKHNRALLKGAGDLVRRGEIIALLGNTGATSYGHHLHFEVWKDGIAYNPQEYLLITQ